MKENLRIVFIGTPVFAVESLKILIENNYNIVGVITATDKFDRRKKKMKFSALKEFALKKNLKILQPENLKNIDFLKELKSLKANLQIVVAFRMLPELVWKMPKFGTFNLHASILPQYRGAAPINWAIINGEKETGLTTFFLKQKIDTGDIIFQKKVKISDTDNAETLHNKLMLEGSKLTLKTIKSIKNNDFKTFMQDEIICKNENLKNAPKIFKETCKINWGENSKNIYNHIRGLSPAPCAWTNFLIKKKCKILKIFSSKIEISKHNFEVCKIISDNKNYLKIAVKDGFIFIEELQMMGKKRMPIKNFLNGFNAEEISIN